jgi:hypothetical protein
MVPLTPEYLSLVLLKDPDRNVIGNVKELHTTISTSTE